MKKTKFSFTTIKSALLAVFASLVLTASAQAATFTVTNTSDGGAGSLRAAIAAANASPANDVIEFNASLSGQTITLSGTELFIANNGTLTINGLGANQLTVSGNNASRVFLIGGGANAAISGITVSGGNGVSPSDSTNGGGIINYGTLTITNAIVRNNTAAYVGGGISNWGFNSRLTVTNSTISNNISTGNAGGGIYATGGGTLIVTDSIITGNSSLGGGGIRIFNGTATLTNSTVSGNQGSIRGGGFSNSGSATITNSLISENTSNNGAGISNNGTLTVTDSTVRANTTVNGEPATNAGGGLYNFQNGTLIVNGSTVSGNSTTNTGAGIYNRSALALNNSTVSGNTGANWGGGGIRVEGGGAATINSSTISNNSSTNFGGGISVVDAGSTATLNNTIIANSPAGGDCFSNFGGSINAVYSLLESGLACVNGLNSNNLTADPNLGALQNNGGATETHALLAFSPAIDSGFSTLTTDQRGLPRPVDLPSYPNAFNAADIGAFELQAAYDSDEDGVSDNIDNCLNTSNTDQANFDGDLQGDACDADDDNDGVADAHDAFPFDPNESVDTDSDGIGNNADLDDDGDGQSDQNETACGSNPLDAASKSPDADNDNLPDCVDTDDDNDNIPDTCDVDQNPGAVDFDRDGIVDSSSCDTVIGPPVDKDQCKNGGYLLFNNPTFRNQGQCVSFVERHRP